MFFKKNNKGFTLVELIVVIAVIAIITVIAAPKFLEYIEKSRCATDENAIWEVAHASETAYISTGKKADGNTLEIRIGSEGNAAYAVGYLTEEVRNIIPENAYTYKSKTYRGQTVSIQVNTKTGKAEVIGIKKNSDIRDVFILGDFAEAIFGDNEEAYEILNQMLFQGESISKEVINQIGKELGYCVCSDGCKCSGCGADNGCNHEPGGSEEDDGPGCVATGTKITLADGSTKNVEDLTSDDKLLAFDHETGKYVEADILANVYLGDEFRYVMNLQFADGNSLKLIDHHDLFDVTANEYVLVTNDNLSDFVGHEFAMQNEDGIAVVVLEYAFLSYEYVGAYSIITDYYMNCFTNGFFSNTPGAEYNVNAFEFDTNLQYNPEKMEEDIEKYGLYTYEQCSEYMDERTFNSMPFRYFKVSVGKGIVTEKEFEMMLESYSDFFEMLKVSKDIEYIR